MNESVDKLEITVKHTNEVSSNNYVKSKINFAMIQPSLATFNNTCPVLLIHK